MRTPQITLAVIILVLVVVFVGAFVLQSRGTSPEPNTIENLTPAQYQDTFVTGSAAHLLVDVRTPDEFASGHIEGAVNIPLDALSSRLNEIPRDQPVVVYCRSGSRSAQAARLLSGAGYTQVRDLGGITAWMAAGYPVQ